MATDSIRELIIQALLYNLSDWTENNSFNHSCGANRYRARHFWEINEAPCVSLWPQPESNNPKYGKNYNTMPVRLEALTTYTTSQNPSVISEQILADMKEIMGRRRSETVDDLADGVQYVEGGAEEYPDSSQSVVGCSAIFNISYWENKSNPYEQ